MRSSSIIILGLIFVGCAGNEQSEAEKILEEAYIQEKVDSTMMSLDEEMELYKQSLLWDTVGIDQSGLEIVSAEFVKTSEYSNYKSVKISYKNVTDKDIKAIRFKWYGLNAFDEPADCGNSSNEGFGSGYMDDGLKAGKTTSGTWSISSRDGDRIIKAWPYEVVFKDGTKWKSTYIESEL